MDKIQVTPTTLRRLLHNADDYAAEMMAIATPEQIESVRCQNDLFNRGLRFARIAAWNQYENRNFVSIAVRTNFRFNLKV